MDDRNKLIEKLGELSAKAYMFGRMYHIDEVAELTKDINELIAKVFDYSPWYTGTPTEEGWYLFSYKYLDTIRYGTDCLIDGKWVFNPALDEKMLAWQKIEPFKED